MKRSKNACVFQIYVFAIIFAFFGTCLAETVEEKLRSFGWDDFILGSGNAEPAEESSKAEEIAEAEETEETEYAETTENIEATEANQSVEMGMSARRQPMSASFSNPMPRGGSGGPTGDTSSVRISVFDTAGVTRELAIDFSRNLSEYRSPQRALFLSLLVPGLGQVYNKKYWRTGLYAAIEIGMIGGAVYFNRDAKRVRKDAENFADTHFSRSRLEDFYTQLINNSRKHEIYQPENDSLNLLNELIFGHGSGFVDSSKFFTAFDEDFYGKSYGVGSTRYSVQGWNDAKPYFHFPFEGNLGKDSLYMLDNRNSPFGTSARQNHYISQIDYSIKQGRRSSVFIVGIFANHVVSATDAFISAIIHNRRLLKEESGESTRVEDILSRISIESDTYFDHKNDLTTKIGLVWRF